MSLRSLLSSWALSRTLDAREPTAGAHAGAAQVRLPAPTSELQEVLAELGVEDAEDMARHPCSAEGITCHEGRGPKTGLTGEREGKTACFDLFRDVRDEWCSPRCVFCAVFL